MLLTPNIFHVDKFRVSFGSVPDVDPIYLDMFDQSVKSVTIPEYLLDVDRNQDFKGYQVQNPLHKSNINLPQLQMEMKINENLYNYFKFWQLISNIRNGENITTEFIKNYCCKSITISLLNNQKLDVANFVFTKCFPTALGTIPLATGSGDEGSFAISFAHEQVTFSINTDNNVLP